MFGPPDGCRRAPMLPAGSSRSMSMTGPGPCRGVPFRPVGWPESPRRPFSGSDGGDDAAGRDGCFRPVAG